MLPEGLQCVKRRVARGKLDICRPSALIRTDTENFFDMCRALVLAVNSIQLLPNPLASGLAVGTVQCCQEQAAWTLLTSCYCAVVVSLCHAAMLWPSRLCCSRASIRQLGGDSNLLPLPARNITGMPTSSLVSTNKPAAGDAPGSCLNCCELCNSKQPWDLLLLAKRQLHRML